MASLSHPKLRRTIIAIPFVAALGLAIRLDSGPLVNRSRHGLAL